MYITKNPARHKDVINANFSSSEVNSIVACLKIMNDNYDFPIMHELENELSKHATYSGLIAEIEKTQNEISNRLCQNHS